MISHSPFCDYAQWKDERLVEHEQRIAMLEDLLHRALLSVARQDSSGPLKDDDELQSAVEDTHDTEVDFRNRSSQLVTAVDVCEKLLLGESSSLISIRTMS